MNCKIINTDDRFAKVHMTTPLEGVAERLHAEYFRDTDILPALPPYSLNTENPPQVLRLFAKDSGALPVIRPIGKGTTVKPVAGGMKVLFGAMTAHSNWAFPLPDQEV